MSEVKFNFLNYRPALEDEQNQGLVKAENVVHEVGGYKPIHLQSAGAFSTAVAGVSYSAMAKPIGSQGDVLAAWVNGNSLHVGVNGVTSTSTTTGYPLSFATSGSSPFIYAFDVCEAEGKVFFTVEARQTEQGPITATLVHSGYMDF